MTPLAGRPFCEELSVAGRREPAPCCSPGRKADAERLATGEVSGELRGVEGEVGRVPFSGELVICICIATVVVAAIVSAWRPELTEQQARGTRRTRRGADSDQI